MDRIGSWGQMIKMNWPEILGYIGKIPRILTMIPVRENNEVAIKFTQISSYIINSGYQQCSMVCNDNYT